jgi:hypothetical protein
MKSKKMNNVIQKRNSLKLFVAVAGVFTRNDMSSDGT